ncbi:hypothetical protein PMI14_05121 [Acidovorax sp. CF316]|uniref:hypothetical protein n=1 Tax=Acidovorax sp. CF316 TaxID=1144317 RepID=UPI00026BEF0D|nr:hypothetical protein [Acidovorax sp. CF316]EJE50316.1 hypothetical protein PMI14_05121 [Acidovorax sp. CF316]
MGVRTVSLALIIGGLAWLGAEYAENRKRPSRLKVPTEAELSTVSGKAIGARVVEHKSKKNVLASRYTELDVKGSDGVVTLRLGDPHSERVLNGLSGETVTAKFDPKDEKTIFSLSTPSRQVVAYRDTAAYKHKLVESNSGGYVAGWIAMVLGIAGFWFSRKPQ